LILIPIGIGEAHQLFLSGRARYGTWFLNGNAA